MKSIVLRAEVAIPELGIDAGEYVVVNPGREFGCSVVKRVVPAAVLQHYALGGLVPLDEAPDPAALARVLGVGGGCLARSPAPEPLRPGPVRRGCLVLVGSE